MRRRESPARGLGGVPGAAVVAALIVVILVQLVVGWAIGLFPRLTAIDFYQYWGVSAALRLSGHTLGGPYRNQQQYRSVLRDFATQSDQSKLAAVSQAMPRPSFTATPFLYTLFGALPADYTRAIGLFQALQVVLFLTAVFLLGMIYRFQIFPLTCLALLLLVNSGPLYADLRVGNLGSLQFAALTALLVLADRLQHAARATLLGGVVLTGLVLLFLAKPNVALVIPMMVAHLWLRRGSRFLAIAAVPAALFGAAAVVIPQVYFRSWTVWREWYDFVYGHNPSGLVRPAAGGNYSTSLLLARWIQADVGTAAGVIAAVLSVSLIVVMVVSVRTERASARLRHALEGVFGDVRLAMAIGITLTIALPPLYWYHYNVIALIPGLWFLSASSGSRSLRLCGLAALVLSAGLLNTLFRPLGWDGAVEVSAALSWIPLWAAILLRLASTGAQKPVGAPAPPSTSRPEERRTTKGRTARRSRRSRAPFPGEEGS
jgi:hypothetical protein